MKYAKLKKRISLNTNVTQSLVPLQSLAAPT